MVELRPHQKAAVSQLGNGKVLYGGVGTGKSLTALTYYTERESPKDIYVITTAKKRDSLDWEGEAAKYGIGKAKDATVAGVLTVDSWNNINKYIGVQNAFFIMDEQRLVGSGAWVKAFIRIARANRWILLSGTPGDTWLDYIPLFVANGYYKNRTEFKRTHVVYNTYSKFPKVDHYIGVGKLVRLRNELLVHMPYERHTTRHVKIVDVAFNKELLDKAVKERWHVYENRPLKDVAELFSVMRKIVNSDASRLEYLRELIKTHPKVIVFYNFDYELEMLRTLSGSIGVEETQPPCTSTQDTVKHVGKLANAKITLNKTDDDGTTSATEVENVDGKHGIEATSDSVRIAEWNGHKHEEVPDSERWIYLVQYTAGAEGWNCIATNATVFFSQNYSFKILEQAMGRIDRLNTPFTDLYYYILRSKSVIDLAIGKAISSKKSFNERDFKVKVV